jgi:hypothetical protein
MIQAKCLIQRFPLFTSAPASACRICKADIHFAKSYRARAEQSTDKCDFVNMFRQTPRRHADEAHRNIDGTAGSGGSATSSGRIARQAGIYIDGPGGWHLHS